MKFEWDEEKRQANLRKHRLDFADAWEIFLLPMVIGLDDRANYGEDRWSGIGMLKGRVVAIVYTEQADTIRVISLRKALAYERTEYAQTIGN
jgi:hypothetical protein